MADLLDDDADAAAMAEAMGFSGFGSQRPAKRKFNANADAVLDVEPSPDKKKGGNVSKTGANNAPLGARRQLSALPAALSARPTAGFSAAASATDPDEIDLGENENVYNTSDPHRVIDTGPPGLPARPSQPSFGRGQNRGRGRGGRGGRGGGGHDFHSSGGVGDPWWEGYYDARMNENPWEQLEMERGLQPRGTWVARHGGHGRVAPESSPGPSQAPDTNVDGRNTNIDGRNTSVDGGDTNVGGRKTEFMEPREIGESAAQNDTSALPLETVAPEVQAVDMPVKAEP